MFKQRPVLQLLTIALLFGLAGCPATGSYDSFRTDNKILIGDTARQIFDYEGIERNPVIVIPGIFGSRLKDSVTGDTVWGLFTGKEMIDNFSVGQIRLMALPMAEGKPLSELKDTVVPAGVLETVKVRLLGLPLHANGYKDMIDALEQAGYYGEGSKLGKDRRYDTRFSFGYDFRRDLVENAKLLHAFIAEKKKYLQEKYEKYYGVKDYDVKFDIVAHSMGGLLTRYYLMYGDQSLPQDGSTPDLNWAGAKNVGKAIIVGTPNAGYLDAFTELVEGMTFSPGVPKIEPAVLGTYPTLYQMMPLADMGMVVDAKDEERVIDVFSPDIWLKMQWGLADPRQDKTLKMLLPGVKTAEERRAIAIDHLKKCLTRARQFTSAMRVDSAPPDGTKLYLFLGESIPTHAVASVDEAGRIKVIRTQPGDGKVSTMSAIFNERKRAKEWPFMKSPIQWSSVNFLFGAHMGITRDPVFVSNMTYILLAEDEKPAAA